MKKLHYLFLYVLIIFFGCAHYTFPGSDSSVDASPIKTAELLFKSGFENGVILNKPVADDGGIWWQQIKGSDIGNFSWPMDIYGRHKGELQLIVDYYGQIKLVDPINAVMVFTNYASEPFHQWIDNIEIWSSFPSFLFFWQIVMVIALNRDWKLFQSLKYIY